MYNQDFFKKATNSIKWQSQIALIMLDIYPDIESVVDIGCGLGAYLDGYLSKYIKVKGYELSYDTAKEFIPDHLKQYIEYGDASKPMTTNKYDLSESIEVAEHIEEQFADVFIRNLCNASNKYILFSAAPPRGRTFGEGHVNEQPSLYWMEKINKYNFVLDQAGIDELRWEIDRLGIRSRYLSCLKHQLFIYKKRDLI